MGCFPLLQRVPGQKKQVLGAGGSRKEDLTLPGKGRGFYYYLCSVPNKPVLLQLLRKYIGIFVVLLVFFQLPGLNAGSAAPLHKGKTLIVHAAGHTIALHPETRISRTRYKLPDERRKYFLSETDAASPAISGDPVIYNACIVSFTGESQQHIRPRAVSLALLRAPPIA